MKKRLLSILLTVCMALTLLPTAALATGGTVTEQFNLPIGGTYYFDLSGEVGKIGTINIGTTGQKARPGVPDPTLHYVPFTYAGTVNAYSLTSGQASTAATASDRSLFVADYNVSHKISWDTLNRADLIFGKEFDTNYTLRSLSVGSATVNNADTQGTGGTPATNEWDSVLTKSNSSDNATGWIKNWDSIYSWGQDTCSNSSNRARRGFTSAAYWSNGLATSGGPAYFGWRPALEVDTATLTSDGLKVVALNLNGGKLKDSETDINIVCAGDTFTAPSGEGLTRPSGNGGTAFHWKGSDNKTYAVGDSVPSSVTALTAQWTEKPPAEQFNLPIGQTYYFDLSGELGTVTEGVSDKIGTINPGHAENKIYPGVPDPTLHYVPFTYAGTVNAYSLTSGQASTAATASAHSLFVADYNVSRTITWNDLNTVDLIFGKPFDTNYKLRSLSAGSAVADISTNLGGTPATNEWDSVLTKSNSSDNAKGWIKNWSNIYSWGQDTSSTDSSYRALRGSSTAADWSSMPSSASGKGYGWRPALEVDTAKMTNITDLKAVTLDLNGGSFDSNGSEADGVVNSLNIVCAGDTFKAPSATALTRPTGNTDNYFKWNTQADGGGTNYAVGDSVPSSVTALTAQWTEIPQVTTHTITASAGTGGTISPSGSVTVNNGESQTFTITPNSGYSISSVTVDGVNQGAIGSHTFSNVTANHSISATFSYNGGGGGGDYTPTLVTEIKSGESITGDNLDRLISNKKNLTVTGADGAKLVFGTDALRGINDQTSASVKVEIKDVSAEHQDTHKGKNVFTLIVTSGGKTVSGFDGKVTISLPYTLKDGEKAEDVTVWYISEDGSMTEIPSTYDPKTGLATATVNYFPKYVVGVLSNPFTDVDSGAYYYDALLWAVGKNITGGTSTTTFGPDLPCTRAQAVTFLWRAAGSPAATGNNPFTDVDSGAYYYDAVLWAVEKGVTKGTSATTFAPNIICNRGHIATFLYRYAGSSTVLTGNNPFTDVDSGVYYYDAVLWAVEKGITKGTSATIFAPGADCTRGQIITFLYRHMGK